LTDVIYFRLYAKFIPRSLLINRQCIAYMTFSTTKGWYKWYKRV